MVKNGNTMYEPDIFFINLEILLLRVRHDYLFVFNIISRNKIIQTKRLVIFEFPVIIVFV